MSDIKDVNGSTPELDKVDGCVGSKLDNKSLNNSNENKVVVKEDEQIKNGNHCENNNAGDENKKTEVEKNEPPPPPEEEVEPDPYFTPKVTLPLVEVSNMEYLEDIIVELRARIYRFDTSDDEEGAEFKERGTGVLKILRHKEDGTYRILMRRDKTLKICANHHITSSMELNKHNNSNRVFVYSTFADLYEDEISPETFAIRFSSPENATIFKNAFDDAVKEAKRMEKEKSKQSEQVNDLTKDLEKVNLESEQQVESGNEQANE